MEHFHLKILNRIFKNIIVIFLIQGIIIVTYLNSFICGQSGFSEIQSNQKEIKNQLINASDSCEKYRWNDLQKTKYFAESAYQIIKKQKIENLPEPANIFFYLGFVKLMENHQQQALSFFKQAENIWEKFPENNSPNISRTYGNIANILRDKGDYEQALIYYQKTYNLHVKNQKVEDLFTALVYTNKGLTYERTGLLDSAKENYQKALRIHRKLCGDISIETATSYHNLGYIQLLKKEFRDAQKSFDLALKKFETSNEYELEADVLNNLGTLNLEINELNKAQLFYRKALNIRKKTFHKPHPQIVQSFFNLGIVYQLKNIPDSALYYFQQSLKMNLFRGSESDCLSAIDLLDTYKSMAEIIYKKFETENNKEPQLQMSYLYLKKAMVLLEDMRFGYQAENSKLQLSENTSEIYQLAIHIALKIFDLTGDNQLKTEAFSYSEKNKAAILKESVMTAQAKKYSGIPDSLLQKEKRLKQDIGFAETNIQQEKLKDDPDQQIIYENIKIITDLKILYSNLIEFFEKNFPSYYQNTICNNVISIDQIQSKLDQKTAFIEYTVSDTTQTITTFAITKDTFVIYHAKYEQKIKSKLRSYFESLHTIHKNFKDFKNYTEQAFWVYTYLLAPLENVIRDKNLIIAPDGILAYLPFEAMISEENKSKHVNYSELKWLLNKKSISYAFSGTLQFLLNDRFKQIPVNYLAAFLPSLDTIVLNKWTLISNQSEWKNKLDKNELKIFSDSNASKTNFKKYAGNYKIVHLFTHGILNTENPLESILLFSPDAISRGEMTISELYGLHLNTKLMVLSACNTGSGKITRGEGVMSIARSFYNAGVPSLITTLWTISDKASANITSSLYQRLEEGNDKSLALRLAKLDYVTNTLQTDKIQPYYWAGFQLIGDTSKIENSNNHWMIFLIISFCAVFGVFIFNQRK